MPLRNPQRGRGWRGRRGIGGWGGPSQGVWHHRRGATAAPAQCLAAHGDAGKRSQMPTRCAELAPRSPRPQRRLEPGWPRSHPGTVRWCHSRRRCAHTRAGATAHPRAGDTRTATASPTGAWQPLPVLDGLPAAAGGKARFLGRAPLNRADTAAIGRVEVSCQATARELPATSEGVRGVTEAEGQTLACLADRHRSPGRPGHRPRQWDRLQGHHGVPGRGPGAAEGAGTVGEMDAGEQSPRLAEGRELPAPPCLRLGLALALEVIVRRTLRLRPTVPVHRRRPNRPSRPGASGQEERLEGPELAQRGRGSPEQRGGRETDRQTEAELRGCNPALHAGAPCQGL